MSEAEAAGPQRASRNGPSAEQRDTAPGRASPQQDPWPRRLRLHRLTLCFLRPGSSLGGWAIKGLCRLTLQNTGDVVFPADVQELKATVRAASLSGRRHRAEQRPGSDWAGRKVAVVLGKRHCSD